MTKVSKADYETLAAFRYALRQFLHFSEEAAGKVGLTLQQHQALLAIKGYPGRDYVTIGESAERLRIRHHSVVGLVDRLEAQNLAARQGAEADRRQVYVTGTPHGVSLLEQIAAAHRTELQRIGPQIRQLLTQLGISEKDESLAGH